MTITNKSLYHASVGVGTTSPFQTIPAVAIIDEFGNQVSSFSSSTSSILKRTPTTTSVASSVTSVLLLAANANRNGISINNQSTSTLYLSFTNPATIANSFLAMDPGSFLLLDQQLMISNAIYGIWSSANGTAQITEYV